MNFLGDGLLPGRDGCPLALSPQGMEMMSGSLLSLLRASIPSWKLHPHDLIQTQLFPKGLTFKYDYPGNHDFNIWIWGAQVFSLCWGILCLYITIPNVLSSPFIFLLKCPMSFGVNHGAGGAWWMDLPKYKISFQLCFLQHFLLTPTLSMFWPIHDSVS